MNELIKINQSSMDGQQVNTVNARDLYEFLGVKKDFTTWAKVQIDRARLKYGRDYIMITIPPLGGLEGNRGVRTEYHFTLEAGKHIAMMSGAEKGFEVRDYFIECERIAKNPITDPMTILNDPAAMRTLLLTYTEKVIALEEHNAALTPKAEALDRISTADGLMCITDAAKSLQVRPKDLFAWLQSHEWIYRRTGGSHWNAYQNRIQQGYMSHKVTTVSRSDGSEKVVEQALVTAKGLSRLAEIFQAKMAA